MQLLLRCRIAPDPRITSQPQPKHGEPPTETPLTAEPSCKDEARIGQQGTLTRVWAKRGTRPRAPRDQRYEWVYIFGAVCPQRGATAALVVPTANTEVMSLHLAEIGRRGLPGRHPRLVLHGARDHLG